MAIPVRIAIDLDLIRSNLASVESRDISQADVLEFLAEAGFIRSGEHWIAEEISLDVLDASEWRRADL